MNNYFKTFLLAIIFIPVITIFLLLCLIDRSDDPINKIADY